MELQQSDRRLNAALIIIGDEILSGQTKDENIHTIALFCEEMGIELKEVRVVGDELTQIISSLNDVRVKYDYVFTTGGIGPTHDDITAIAVAKAFNVDLEINQQALQMLANISDTKHVSEGRKRMARIPIGAELIENFVSGAPGFILENTYVLAGVPKIMQAMLEDIGKKIPHGTRVFSKVIYCGVGESTISAKLEDIQNLFQDVKIGSYPKIGKLPIFSQIVLRSSEKARLKKAALEVQKMVDKVHKKYDINMKDNNRII